MLQEVRAENSPISLGDMINQLYELREQKRAAKRELDRLNDEYRDLEQDIMAKLDEQGLDLGRGSVATVSISETVVPTVEDWDQVEQYILENEALYLYERRLTATAWRELMQSGETVPGTKPFTKRALSLRKLPSTRSKAQ